MISPPKTGSLMILIQGSFMISQLTPPLGTPQLRGNLPGFIVKGEYVIFLREHEDWWHLSLTEVITCVGVVFFIRTADLRHVQ